jgi:hypothetical protein
VILALSNILISWQRSVLTTVVVCVQQVDLTEPILSRFDILCVVRDIVDAVQVSESSKKGNIHSRYWQ